MTDHPKLRLLCETNDILLERIKQIKVKYPNGAYPKCLKSIDIDINYAKLLIMFEYGPINRYAPSFPNKLKHFLKFMDVKANEFNLYTDFKDVYRRYDQTLNEQSKDNELGKLLVMLNDYLVEYDAFEESLEQFKPNSAIRRFIDKYKVEKRLEKTIDNSYGFMNLKWCHPAPEELIEQFFEIIDKQFKL